jgi:hypothetical protein
MERSARRFSRNAALSEWMCGVSLAGERSSASSMQVGWNVHLRNASGSGIEIPPLAVGRSTAEDNADACGSLAMAARCACLTATARFQIMHIAGAVDADGCAIARVARAPIGSLDHTTQGRESLWGSYGPCCA